MSGPLDYAPPRRPSSARRAWILTALFVAAFVGFHVVGTLIHPYAERASGQRMEAGACAGNLRTLHQMIARYAADNAGAMPPDLATLVFPGPPPLKVLTCPASTDLPSTAGDLATFRNDVAAGGHCSYVFVDGAERLAALPADAVLVFEAAADHWDEAHVLFADGRVESIDATTLAELRRRFDNGVRPIRLPAP